MNHCPKYSMSRTNFQKEKKNLTPKENGHVFERKKALQTEAIYPVTPKHRTLAFNEMITHNCCNLLIFDHSHNF